MTASDVFVMTTANFNAARGKVNARSMKTWTWRAENTREAFSSCFERGIRFPGGVWDANGGGDSLKFVIGESE